MAQRVNRSEPDTDELLSSKTPTARALQDLRHRVFQSKIGPGAITDLADELDVDRSWIGKMIQPSSIRLVARMEKHLSENDNDS